jgi:hypothetical protein
MDWTAVTAIATLGLLLVGIATFLNSKLEKEKKNAEANRNATKEILDYAATLRKLLDDKENRIQQLERRTDELYKIVPEARTSGIVAQKRADLAQQKLDAEKERDQWKRLAAVGKAIGWVLERMKEDEE